MSIVLHDASRCAALLIAAASFLHGGGASAYTIKTLYNFCTAANCADGSGPDGPLVRDGSGNLFGTASAGGANDGGTVFELAPDGTETVIANICAKTSCPDGQLPTSGVIMDMAGNLYGTALRGGLQQSGVVFELIANPARTAWKYKALHHFCQPSCAAGQSPNGLTYQGQASGALYDGASPLFGTTTFGGANDGGTAFSLTPRGRKWKYEDIHDFCNGCTGDGSMPEAAMIEDAAGNLYGTTNSGGTANNGGTIFELRPRTKNKWVETVLYQFCPAAFCADGSSPQAPLILDAAGNLLGTTSSGGQTGEHNTVFKLVPKGVHSKYSVLYTFCSLQNCADGSGSNAALTLDGSGNLFGPTTSGGDPDSNGGVLFALNPDYRTLYTFCALTSCHDGAQPVSPLLPDGSGELTGMTVNGGTHGQGEVFELTP
jgi:uncharacterized repeat protein (TIGR03803 family)